MIEFLGILDNLDIWVVIWLFPVTLSVHVVEELSGLVNWYQRNFTGLPLKVDVSIPTFLVVSTFFVFLLTAATAALGSPHLAAWLLLPLAAAVFWNALQHIYHALYFKQYVPGAISSILLLIPEISYLSIRAVGDRLVPLWFISGLTSLILLGLILVVAAGKKLTTEFHIFHQIGLFLSRLLHQGAS